MKTRILAGFVRTSTVVSLLTVALVLGATVRHVEAVAVTFSFDVELTGVLAPNGRFDTLGLMLSAGDPVSGTFTFDSDAADEEPHAQLGNYRMSGSPFGMTVAIGGRLFAFPVLFIQVVNDFPSGQDQFLVSGSGLVIDGVTVTAGFGFVTFSEEPFDSDALPLSAPQFSGGAFNFRAFRDVGVAPPKDTASGSVQSLSGSVPEPSTVLLLGTGLVGFVRYARARARHRGPKTV